MTIEQGQHNSSACIFFYNWQFEISCICKHSVHTNSCLFGCEGALRWPFGIPSRRYCTSFCPLPLLVGYPTSPNDFHLFRWIDRETKQISQQMEKFQTEDEIVHRLAQLSAYTNRIWYNFSEISSARVCNVSLCKLKLFSWDGFPHVHPLC